MGTEGARGQGDQVFLSGKAFQAGISLQTARLEFLARSGGISVLHSPVSISIKDEVNEKTRVLNGPFRAIQSSDSSCSFVQQVADLTIMASFAAANDLSWRFTLKTRQEEGVILV